MKKLLLAISTLAAMVAVSCNKENAPVEVVGEEPEVFEVKIGMGGAITSEMVPMTKSGVENDQLIGISVWSCPADGDTYTEYAYGLFDINDISVKLISGFKYKFDARTAFGGKELINHYGTSYWDHFSRRHNGSGTSCPLDNIFHYEAMSFSTSEDLNNNRYSIDLYYGEVNDYIPTKDGSVTIDMERTSFGLSVDILNLQEGCSATVRIAGLPDINIAYPSTSYYSLYSLSHFVSSYRSDDYYEELTISADLLNADNVTIPLGSTTIKVKRNHLTKVKINANPPTTENAFSLQYSEDPLVDSEEDTYEIGGGEVIDTPVE